MGTVNKSSKLFILHGWTTSLGKWEPFLELLKKEGFDPVLLKIPGLTQETDKIWGLEDYVEWLYKKIKNDRDVILIGHSSGGRMLLAYAYKYPKNIKNLILIDSAGIYHNNLQKKLKRFLFRKLAQVGKKLTSSETFRNLLYKLAREKDYYSATPLQKQIMKNLISQDLSHILENIQTKTLIIWGKGDKTTPLTDGQIMHKMIKNSKLYIIEGAKHSPQFTHPEIVVSRILREISK